MEKQSWRSARYSEFSIFRSRGCGWSGADRAPCGAPGRTVLGVALLAVLAGGCNYLLPLAFLGNPKEKVPPEFDKLAGKRALILVWAHPATLFDYPHVQFELANYVGDKLQAELKNTTVVDPVRVADYRERTLEGSPDPQVVGREFDADMVVYIELLQFQIRDPDAPDYLRARIEASIAVYDLHAERDQSGVYQLKPVDVVYPEHSGVLFNSSNSTTVRQAAYLLFAEKVARKFYEYEEEP